LVQLSDDSVKQEITSRVQEQVSRELKKIRREMVEEMKRLKIEINFQKKTRSEIEMENMYLKEERLQWEKDMDDLKAVVVEWRQEALHMRDQLTALHSEVERQKEEIAKYECVRVRVRCARCVSCVRVACRAVMIDALAFFAFR
jgi:chromosome segregation ATPase